MKRIYRSTIRKLGSLGEPVVIPQALIDRMRPDPHFIKVAKPEPGNPESGKGAFENGWQEHPYQADDPELQSWLQSGGNYGVQLGYGVIGIDGDKPEIRKICEEKLPETFTVQSGGGGDKRHFYYRASLAENGVLDDAIGENVGHVQVFHKFLVGPGSRHNSGGTYKVVKDLPLAWVSKEQIEAAFGELLTWTGQRQRELAEESADERKKLGVDIPLSELIDLSNFKLQGGEMQGAHPLHGSTTGNNLRVDTTNNVWHCFRHHSGGGGLQWLAVQAGLIKCVEAKKGALRGQLFMDAVRIARERGFKVDLPDEELNPDVERFFEEDDRGRPKFVPARVAKELMNEAAFFTESNRSQLYRYDANRGIYRPDGESYIDKQLTVKLGKHYNIRRKEEVTSYIRSSSIAELPEMDKYLLACKNGVLNVLTRGLKPFSPDFIIFNAIPVTYIPYKQPTDSEIAAFRQKYPKEDDEPYKLGAIEEQCLENRIHKMNIEWRALTGEKLVPVRFLKFLSDVSPSEADRLVLQEHAGYNLLKDCRFQKALMLIGNTQNGKGTLLKVWMALLGKENVSTLPLQMLKSSMRFYTAQLEGKLANICTDLPNESLTETDAFKKVVSGDPITGERKHQTPFDFTPYAKLLFSANELPSLPSDEDAFLVRWNLVSFPNQFMPGDPRRDENLLEKLTTPEELSGVLNWALDGLDRLLKNKGFSNGESLEQAKDRWIVEGDSVGAFVQRCVVMERGSTAAVTVTDNYEKYYEFCKRHGVNNPKGKVQFGNIFKEKTFASKQRTHLEGKEVWVWRGISLKDEDSEEQDTLG